jgi:hypothetical protein
VNACMLNAARLQNAAACRIAWQRPSADIFSWYNAVQIWFLYCDPLIQLGAQKHLEQTDLWDVAKVSVWWHCTTTHLLATVRLRPQHPPRISRPSDQHGAAAVWAGYIRVTPCNWLG